MSPGTDGSSTWPPEPGKGARAKKAPWRRLAAGLVVLAAAAGTAFASGLGSKAADRATSHHVSLVTSSAVEVDGDCVGGTFLANPAAQLILKNKPPAKWATVQHHTGAAFVDTDSVEVSVQGTSAQVITLTSFSIDVTRLPRPSGAVFRQPCGGFLEGRSLSIDVEATPPKVVASSKDPEGIHMQNGRPVVRPIKFPWTVSVTDPLVLYIRASANSCLCRWKARLAWVSGSERGIIHVDNGGKGYTVVGGKDLPAYAPFERWRREG